MNAQELQAKLAAQKNRLSLFAGASAHVAGGTPIYRTYQINVPLSTEDQIALASVTAAELAEKFGLTANLSAVKNSRVMPGTSIKICFAAYKGKVGGSPVTVDAFFGKGQTVKLVAQGIEIPTEMLAYGWYLDRESTGAQAEAPAEPAA